MLYNMRQVEVNTLNMLVFGCDKVKGHSQTTANINQSAKVLKTLVNLEDLLDNNGGVIVHSRVENLIKPWIQAWVIESMGSMDSIKWNSPFKNCIFQLGPTL